MRNAEKNNEKEILSLIANDDEQAFATLFNQYANLIYGIAVKLSGSAQIAEEVVQEVFLKVWLKRERIAEVRDVKAYLFIVTRNHIYSLLRDNARMHREKLALLRTTPYAENNIDVAAAEKEYDVLLRKAVEQLSRQQKNVFYLVKELGLKRNEAAKLLKLQPETIKHHLSEAMKNIKNYCLPFLPAVIILTSLLLFLK